MMRPHCCPHKQKLGAESWYRKRVRSGSISVELCLNCCSRFWHIFDLFVSNRMFVPSHFPIKLKKIPMLKDAWREFWHFFVPHTQKVNCSCSLLKRKICGIIFCFCSRSCMCTNQICAAVLPCYPIECFVYASNTVYVVLHVRHFRFSAYVTTFLP